MSKYIAIKELAYFTCQSGNLTSEFFSNKDLEQGKKAHKYLQDLYNKESKSEVYIKKEITYLDEEFILHGYIDGVIEEKGYIVIEEIKSTTHDLEEITQEYHKEHLAQLKVYGYLYSLINNIDPIRLRLTYISVVDYETKSLDFVIKQEELEDFTLTILEEYISWLNLLAESEKNKEITIKSIKFPFSYKRKGQHDLMAATYKALKDKEILYVIAPTGIGKTMATLFSSLKTLDKNDKLFYLTAKGSGKNAPVDAIKLLANKGLKIKTIDITAKRKICNNNLKNCNPEECPFAIGFFDRLKSATFEIFKNHDIYSQDLITNISNKYKICAFEFSLYLSYFCDVIIADYNYVFDPKARLVRYFEDDTYNIKVLVDEAHNLISRSKDMYSAALSEEDIRILRKRLNGIKPSIRKECNKALEYFDYYRDKLALNSLYCDISSNMELNVILRQIYNKCEQIFDENKTINNKEDALEIFFKIMDFLRISEYFGPTHRLLAKIENDNVIINYYCLDASDYILDTITNSVKGIVFFSATLYPIDYHTNLLTKGNGKFIELESPFNPNNLEILINNKVSTRYKNRIDSIDTIIDTIATLVSSKPGNYIIFFPSYVYMNMVLDVLEEPKYECIIQKNTLNDIEKNEIIEKFKNTTNTKVGFFVMGGAFSEGIDLIGDSLSGVIIVGVGLPMVCDENNILKDYFENEYGEGFDYAYTYPGFTKVIQAVGRVIRDYEDKGIAILIDERFTYNKYLSLMPPHWKNKIILDSIYKLKKYLNKIGK